MAYFETAYCYKHNNNLTDPVEYQVCIDPASFTRTGSCPVCADQLLKATTTANTGKALNWLEMSAGYTHL